MAKEPPNLPSEGDRVRLRGRNIVGTLISVTPENKWSRVDWDTFGAPKICHLFELERAE